jgi:ArsR family transcriptional regulator, virulence genes transcriptional regulator
MKITDRQITQFEKEAGRAAAVLKSIGNKQRLLILCQLVKEEQTVGQLLEYIGLSNSALSQHLAVLRANKLVNTRRVSQTIFYSIRGEEVPAVVGLLYELYCAPDKLSEKM